MWHTHLVKGHECSHHGCFILIIPNVHTCTPTRGVQQHLRAASDRATVRFPMCVSSKPVDAGHSMRNRHLVELHQPHVHHAHIITIIQHTNRHTRQPQTPTPTHLHTLWAELTGRHIQCGAAAAVTCLSICTCVHQGLDHPCMHTQGCKVQRLVA